MLDYIVDRLDVNQYGGLRGLSTTHALVDMVHTWLLTAEERKASHVVLLDYRKAFDHVDHTVLVTKCKTYNLPNFIIRWLCAFLSDRSQRVRLGQELSDWVNLKGSVPQGSWPGPPLHCTNIIHLAFKFLASQMDAISISNNFKMLASQSLGLE